MQRLRDLGTALSLANLCFYGVWAELLPGSPHYYFLKAAPSALAFAAIAVNIAGLTVLLWVGAQAVRRSQSALLRGLASAAFLATVALAVNGIRLKLPGLGVWLAAWLGHTGLVAVAGAGAVGVLFALLRWRAATVRAVATVILVCTPVVLVTFGRAVWALIDSDGALTTFRELPLVPPAADRKAPHRVLWMIFDELDQRLVFSARPLDVMLPELDRFRAGALFATQAYPPAGETMVSLPALLTGKLIAKSWPVGASELRTLGSSGRVVRWDTESTIFADARESGWSSALVGWYHPYCRLIGGLTHCAWQEWKCASGTTFREQVAQQIAYVVKTIPGARRLHLLRAAALLEPASGAARRRQFGLDRYRSALAAAQEALADRSVDLIFIHWPIPHPPSVYDRFSGELTAGRRRDGRRSSYLDNLMLADRTLGIVRRALEASGDWKTTTVIITADHGYRTSVWAPKLRKTDEERTVIAGEVDHRVPFLLKVAGDNRALTYDAAFNTLVAHDLILALLAGQIGSSEAAGLWLDAHRSVGVGPYMKHRD